MSFPRHRIARLTGVTAATTLGLAMLIAPAASATTPPTPTEIRAAAIAACTQLSTLAYATTDVLTFPGVSEQLSIVISPTGPFGLTGTTTIKGKTSAEAIGFTGSTAYQSFAPNKVQAAALTYAHKSGPFLHVQATTVNPFTGVGDLQCTHLPAIADADWSMTGDNSTGVFTADMSSAGYSDVRVITAVSGVQTSDVETVVIGSETSVISSVVTATGPAVVIPGVPTGYTNLTSAQIATYIHNYNIVVAKAKAVAFHQAKVRATAGAVAINKWAKKYHKSVTPAVVQARTPHQAGFHFTKIAAGVKVTRPYAYGSASFCIVALHKKAAIKAC